MSNASQSIVQCQCGARLRVPDHAAGRRVKCPKCGFKIAIPAEGAVAAGVAARTPAPPAPPPEPAPDDEDSLLNDFMQAESSAETTAAASLQDAQKSCPACTTPIAKNARTCPMCGHDLRPAPAKAAKAAKAGPSMGSAAKAGGRLMLGTVLSGLGALLGAVVWLVVAMITSRDFNAIAILVGFLAGFGMALGYRKSSGAAGVVACAMTFVGACLGKLLVFAFAVYAVVSGDTGDIGLQRDSVKFQMTEERLVEAGHHSTDAQMEHWDEVAVDIETEVDAMSDEQVRERWQEYRDRESDYELEAKRDRLAEHRAERKVWQSGAEPWGDEYDAFYNAALGEVRAMNVEELDASLAELDAWEAGDCWADPEYVEHFLVYQKAAAARDAELDRRAMDAEDYAALALNWKKHHNAALAEVQTLTPEQRLQEARRIADEQQREQEAFEARMADAAFEGVDAGMVAGGAVLLFFLSFGLTGVVFLAIGISTAYKIGSNGIGTS